MATVLCATRSRDGAQGGGVREALVQARSPLQAHRTRRSTPDLYGPRAYSGTCGWARGSATLQADGRGSGRSDARAPCCGHAGMILVVRTRESRPLAALDHRLWTLFRPMRI